MRARKGIFCLLILLCIWASGEARRLSQTADAAVSALPRGLRRISPQKELEGELTRDALRFGFTVAAEEGVFPDILLSLEVINRAANADLFCAPYNATVDHMPPRWSSESAQGIDYVFISADSPYYEEAITDPQNGVADFVCKLQRVSYANPVFLIEMDESFIKRQLRQDEMAAMERIYEKCCDGPNACQGWKDQSHSMMKRGPSSDIADFDFCHMASSVCDQDGYLVKLTMDRFGLQCEFPVEEVAHFVRLQKLSMIRNKLTGDIYDIAESLQELRHLDEVKLSRNRLSGTLAREFLDPDANPLCTISRQSLKHLHLQHNSIRGPIPECLLAEGSSLRDLVLEENPIGGSIPDVIAEESNLEVIQISAANLTGTFPQTFVHTKHLVLLDLSDNQIEGELPDEFGPSPHLKNLYLRRNLFSGQIPRGIAASETLESVFLDHNQFDSMPEQWLQQGPKTPLVNLDLSFNDINEDFPVVLSLLENLSTLKLNNNKFHGPLPSLSDMFPNAWVINVSSNVFSGKLPEEWTAIGMFTGTAEELEYALPLLDLSYNHLFGRVPPFFLDINNFPRRLLLSKSVNLTGNNFSCPDYGTSDHLRGFENCEEGRADPVYDDSVFVIQDGTDHPLGVDIGTNTQTQTTVFTAGTEESSSGDDNSGTLVVVMLAVGSTMFVFLVLAVAMRYRVFRLKRAKGSPQPSDAEECTESPERLDSSKDLEHSRLREGVQSSDAAPVENGSS